MAKLDSYLERKREAIAARQADWTANPDSALVTIKASSAVAGITGARPTRMGETVVISDSAPGLAGHALGPTAPEMLLGSLASCLVHTYLIQAAMLHIPLDHVEVKVSGRLDYKPVLGMGENPIPVMEDIRYAATVDSPAEAADIERIHAAVETACPVLNTIRQPVSVRREA
ncbi:MAG: OsmC family protein [Anaerolineae bacterium]|nr:OsmC family protein [Anaerolineae bacterium]